MTPETKWIGTASLLAALAVLGGCAPAPESEESPEAQVAATGKDKPAAAWRTPREAPVPPASQPAPDSPEFHARTEEDFFYATGRGRDQSGNPLYLAATAPWIPEYFAGDTRILHDPHRLDWGATRGTEQDVTFTNRYGARLNAKLFGPKLPYTDPYTGGTGNGPFPAVIFMPGAGAVSAASIYDGFAGYEGQLQQLAENGYVVLAIYPQGNGGSELFVPPHPMCDPQGEWKQPQEMGITEQGECVAYEGVYPPLEGEYQSVYGALESADAALLPAVAGTPVAYAGSAVAFTLQGRLDHEASTQATIDAYDVAHRARFVFPALDGADWLLSDENPWRERIDGKRLGIFGHSAGADAALVAGNGDKHRRFSAVVTLDSHGLPPETVPARVPTLVQHAENINVYGPWTEVPGNQFEPPFRAYETLVENEVPAMLVTLRGSTHLEWSYVPYRQHNPVVGPAMPFINASSEGALVGHYYALAWFDRWLQPEREASARSRLLARSFDDSADKTAIDSARFDPAAQAEVPYALAGESVADHLSVWFVSRLSFDGVQCEDWQAGC